MIVVSISLRIRNILSVTKSQSIDMLVLNVFNNFDHLDKVKNLPFQYKVIKNGEGIPTITSANMKVFHDDFSHINNLTKEIIVNEVTKRGFLFEGRYSGPDRLVFTYGATASNRNQSKRKRILVAKDVQSGKIVLRTLINIMLLLDQYNLLAHLQSLLVPYNYYHGSKVSIEDICIDLEEEVGSL